MTTASRPADSRATLTKEAVVDAALAIADAEGLEGLTIRRLAADLGAAPMGLYRYFHNKDDLVTSLFDRVIAEYDPEDHRIGDWKDRMRSSFRWFRRALVSHPGVMPVLARRVGVGDHSDRITESVLAALREVACSDEEAARAFFVARGLHGRLRRARGGFDGPASRRRNRRR